MATLTLTATVRSWVSCGSNQYACKYYVKDNASNSYWHEGMSNATALTSVPADSVLPEVIITGSDATSCTASLTVRCQSLETRLTTTAIPLVNVPVGYQVPNITVVV
jgi:hypothetical protein